MFRKLLLACGALLGLSSMASATPFIGLDDPAGCDNAQWIGVSTTSGVVSLPVNTNGGGVFCLYNAMLGSGDPSFDGGDQPIIDLKLQTTATITGHSATDDWGIDCSSTFFTDPHPEDHPYNPAAVGTCAVNYDPTSKLLSIEFTANPAFLDQDEGQSPGETDTEAGEDEGIPQLPAGCTSPTSSEGCDAGKGIFYVNLDDNNDLHTDTGSWGSIGVTSMDITQLNGVNLPEPSAIIPFGMGLLLLAGFARRRAARRG